MVFLSVYYPCKFGNIFAPHRQHLAHAEPLAPHSGCGLFTVGLAHSTDLSFLVLSQPCHKQFTYLWSFSQRMTYFLPVL